MRTKNNIGSFDEILDSKYGKTGTKTRIKAEETAYSYYSGLLLKDARKKMNMTQNELASKLGTDAAYISRIENDAIIPSAGAFFRIADALGYSVELKPITISK
ncbi:MAG: helix-turn-helix transcriptional regulator [Bacteroidales bacterium]|nr:helix-turn-helix transcriptional regulator [Bacteroidales bacterium]MBP5517579.1 helix-turn-helix transcriptional regulator [Bacteroidales bacterium]